MDNTKNLLETALHFEVSVAPEDYIGERMLLYCGKCKTPKQAKILDYQHIKYFNKRKLPIMCECAKKKFDEENKREEAEAFKRKIERLRRDGLTDPEYSNWTFDKDDMQNASISMACRKYVDEWSQMKADNVGLLFKGNVGTGKTFYACCIANALLEKGIPTLVTNFPRLLRILQATAFGKKKEDPQEIDILDKLQKYELVVIDDLGVERSTEYAMEQIFSAIDTRYRSGKPLIVTTNLGNEDLKSSADIAQQRIYDRILQICPVQVNITGASRRRAIGREKYNKYQDFLGF